MVVLVVRVESERLWARGLALGRFGDFVGGRNWFGRFRLFWLRGRGRRVGHAEIEFSE